MPLTGDYSWTERNESVTVKIPLKGVSPAKVDIFVTSKLLKVNYAPYLVEVLLHGAINEKKHKAMVKDGVLNMILLKVEPGKWGQLAEGGERVRGVLRPDEVRTWHRARADLGCPPSHDGRLC